ncbi:hypothetical protein [Rathayibacter toxicus]|uniref:hypothetical protein n=1 Tax=Rathayibacter toxicus TaxID=145458 RepID=UPI001C04D5E1|nr:hypothetical protein [Rathayibacter toxicus]QWL30834.1 hypothetical protein E2R34_08865 [Rathayibacter toxicus]
MQFGKKTVAAAAVAVGIVAGPLLATTTAQAAEVTPHYSISVDGTHLKFDLTGATFVAKNGTYEVVGLDGKDYGALQATAVSKDGVTRALHYTANNSHEVIISASPHAGIAFTETDDYWHCAAKSGLTGGSASGVSGLFTGPFDPAVVVGGTAVGTIFCN